MAESVYINKSDETEQLLRFVTNMYVVKKTDGIKVLHPVIKTYIVKEKNVIQSTDGGTVKIFVDDPPPTPPRIPVGYVPGGDINVGWAVYGEDVYIGTAGIIRTPIFVSSMGVLDYSITISFNNTLLNFEGIEAIPLLPYLNSEQQGEHISGPHASYTANGVTGRITVTGIMRVTPDGYGYTMNMPFVDLLFTLPETVTDAMNIPIVIVAYNVTQDGAEPAKTARVNGWFRVLWRRYYDEDEQAWYILQPGTGSGEGGPGSGNGDWVKVAILNPLVEVEFISSLPDEFTRRSHIIANAEHPLGQTVRASSSTGSLGGSVGGSVGGGGAAGGKNAPWQAFDNDGDTGWESAAGTFSPVTGQGPAFNPATGQGGTWLQMDLGAQTKPVNYFTLSNRNLDSIATGFELWASNNGTAWTLVASMDDRQPVYGTDTSAYYFENEEIYRYFRLVITEVTPNAEGTVSIGEFALYTYLGTFFGGSERGLVEPNLQGIEQPLLDYVTPFRVSAADDAQADVLLAVNEYVEVSQGARLLTDGASIEALVTGADELVIVYAHDNTLSGGEIAYIDNYLFGGEDVVIIYNERFIYELFEETARVTDYVLGAEDVEIIFASPQGITDVTPVMAFNSFPVPYSASASSEWLSSNLAYRAFDGGSGTASDAGWFSANGTAAGGAVNEYIQLDFGKPQKISEYALTNPGNSSRSGVVDFTFEGSTDGNNFVILDTVTNRDNTPSVTTNHVLYAIAEYRYYRWRCTKVDSARTAVAIGKIQLWGIEELSCIQVTPANMTGNTSPNPYVVSASGMYSANYNPYQAFDGRPAGYGWFSDNGSFSGGVGMAWLQIDLGAAKAVDFYFVRNERQDSNLGAPIDFELQGSSDGSVFYNVDTVANRLVGTLNSITRHELTNRANWRYYRLRITKSSYNTCVAVGQLHLFRYNN